MLKEFSCFLISNHFILNFFQQIILLMDSVYSLYCSFTTSDWSLRHPQYYIRPLYQIILTTSTMLMLLLLAGEPLWSQTCIRVHPHLPSDFAGKDKKNSCVVVLPSIFDDDLYFACFFCFVLPSLLQLNPQLTYQSYSCPCSYISPRESVDVRTCHKIVLSSILGHFKALIKDIFCLRVPLIFFHSPKKSTNPFPLLFTAVILMPPSLNLQHPLFGYISSLDALPNDFNDAHRALLSQIIPQTKNESAIKSLSVSKNKPCALWKVIL